MPNRYGDYARQNPQQYGHLAQYAQAPYSNEYNNRYYNPYSIFFGPESEDYIPGGLTDPRHWDLAKTFANARYYYKNGQARLNELEKNPGYNPKNTTYEDNAAAVKISSPDRKSVITNGLSAPINIYDNSKVGYNSYPENNPNRKKIGRGGYSTALGHSERRVFADALDSLLKSDQYKDLNREGLYAPKDTARIGATSTRDRDLDIFDRLYNNAGTYKNFLTDTDNIVQLWTERPPCSAGGNNCNDFLERILPKNSEVGYISLFEHNPRNDRYNMPKNVSDSSEQFRQAYADHMRRPENERMGIVNRAEQQWQEWMQSIRQNIINQEDNGGIIRPYDPTEFNSHLAPQSTSLGEGLDQQEFFNEANQRYGESWPPEVTAYYKNNFVGSDRMDTSLDDYNDTPVSIFDINNNSPRRRQSLGSSPLYDRTYFDMAIASINRFIDKIDSPINLDDMPSDDDTSSEDDFNFPSLYRQ